MLDLSRPPHECKVVVAMSGGVDSSTAAALLHEAGYQVIGLTMQLYDAGMTGIKKGTCCAGQDIYDAKNVADRLGFPHYVLNYESRFRQSVMDDFADSYMRGETPIPCVRCNQTVKFTDMLAMAKELEADALVTGHYVRRLLGPNGPELHRGIDPIKDQSYFLFATTTEQLAFTHFPLGGMTKEETRHHASRFGLEVADKPESQDICFVPNGNYAEIIEKLRPGAIDPGEIVHITTHEVLGQHQGVIHYTIGQRKGIGIAYPEPLYVIKIDTHSKRVYVGPESALANRSFRVSTVNWLAPALSAGDSKDVTVKVRSAHRGAAATIHIDTNGDAMIQLHEYERAITPGQACVMYEGCRLLGGGWITHPIH